MEKKNMLIGTIMAILCGLVGCVLWGVLYYFEIIAGLASFLIIYLAGMAYKKFGKVKYFSKVDYLILIIISLVELVVTFLVCYGIFIKGIYADAGITVTFMESVAALFEMAEQYADIKSALTMDILVSIFFLIAGIGYYIRQEKRKKRAEEAKQPGAPVNKNDNVTIVPYTEENANMQQPEPTYNAENNNQANAEPNFQQTEQMPEQNVQPSFQASVKNQSVEQASDNGVSVRPFNPETDGQLLNTDVSQQFNTNPTDNNNE